MKKILKIVLSMILLSGCQSNNSLDLAKLNSELPSISEEGFVGIDMSAQGGEVRVGVGKDNKPIIARALTSRQSDFNSQVDKIAVTLGHSDAVVFVIKKQKNILKKFLEQINMVLNHTRNLLKIYLYIVSCP